MVRPAAARHPLIRCGRYWIFFSLRLTMLTRLPPAPRTRTRPRPARRPGAPFGRAQPLARLVLETDEGTQVARGALYRATPRPSTPRPPPRRVPSPGAPAPGTTSRAGA